MDIKKLPYRKNVGAIVFKDDKFLLVQIVDWPDFFLKFPQGGVNNNETKKEALVRELKEELGTDKFAIIKEFPFSHQYDWDEESVRLAGYRWRGQVQTFFLVSFLGKEDEIELDKNELKDYCWVDKEELFEKIDVKHPLFLGYKKIIEKIFQEIKNDF